MDRYISEKAVINELVKVPGIGNRALNRIQGLAAVYIPYWIPCTERLPDTEDKVLCCTANKKGVKNIVVGYYFQGHGWVCGMNSNVVAWQPLPEPYEGSE